MDNEANVKMIEHILMKTMRCSREESVIILNAVINRINKDIAEEKSIADTINKRIEERKAREAERLRIQGYKQVRFKKPLLPLEDRRQYTRFCKKCKEYYRTFSKYGTTCDGCKQSGVSDGVPPDMDKNLGRKKE